MQDGRGVADEAVAAGDDAPADAALADAYADVRGDDSIQYDLPDVHARIRGNDDIQYELPDMDAPEPAETPAWLEWLAPFFEAIAPAIPYVLIAVLTGLLLYFFWPYIAERLRDWRHDGPRQLPDWRPEERAARVLLEEADALAAEGRYAEAARVLLYRSIEDIAAQRPDLVRPAYTAREIAAHDAMPADARGVFGSIAQLVERGLFARAEVVEGEWRDVRGAYDRFVFAGAV
ncbi:MAG: hypothetical protein WA979_07875 [Pacificimonas sp.]